MIMVIMSYDGYDIMDMTMVMITQMDISAQNVPAACTRLHTSAQSCFCATQGSAQFTQLWTHAQPAWTNEDTASWYGADERHKHVLAVTSSRQL
jgi:hypothetical protein